MRNVRWLLLPLTATWFGGIGWLIWRGGACGCTVTSAAYPSAYQAIAVAADPGTVPVVEPFPTAAAPFIDPLLTEAFVIPFSKNKDGSAPAQDLVQFATAFKAHLATNPNATITITGHTDADGDAALNRRLSLSRAQAVAVSLIDLGIPPAHVHTAGAGADEPVADNLTSKGKALNRRVEITLDQPPAQPQQP